jgi:hypothetical protein
VQTFYTESGNHVFTRSKTGANWDAWQELALNSKFATVTGTLPATIDTYVAVAFPSGFNSENCCIIGHMEYASNGASWYSNNPSITVLSEKVQGIRIKTSESAFAGQAFKINLMKI